MPSSRRCSTSSGASTYASTPHRLLKDLLCRCFIGYSNANYALAEVRDPVRTIRRAAPLAMISVTIVYMFVNVAYFAVVDRAEIAGSGRIVAALYFGRLWGVNAERVRAHFPMSCSFTDGNLTRDRRL